MSSTEIIQYRVLPSSQSIIGIHVMNSEVLVAPG